MRCSRLILLVEDDPELSATLVEAFAEEGSFRADRVGSVAEARQKLAHGRFDAILLDIGLPDGDGRDFCAELRQAGNGTPVIMLTGRTAEVDVVCGLGAGANDYVVKPVRMAELLARLRAQLRAHYNSENATFVIGPYQFRPGARLLLDQSNTRKIHLTSKEAAILKHLHCAQGRPVRVESLTAEIWGRHDAALVYALQAHIYRLRRKMEPRATRFQFVQTARFGYKLDSTTGIPAAASKVVP